MFAPPTWDRENCRVSVVPGTDALLEREDEIARLSTLLEAVSDGAGRLVLVEGPAGIGKTSVLMAVRAMAEDCGFVFLGARCSPIEQEFAFGVARQLFERKVRTLDESTRTEVFAGAAALAEVAVLGGGTPSEVAASRATIFPSLHGLFWLCANLADRSPLLITIDDAQWADDPSVRWLSYLSRRLEDVRALVILARRPTEPGAEAAELNRLATQAAGDMVTLDPLSEKATAQLVARTLGNETGPELVRACHFRTGGNPFLLNELLSAVLVEPGDRSRRDSRSVRALRPVSVTRTVLGRLSAMPDGCRSMAEAVAVLETEVELRHAAALSELPLPQAAAAIDTLAAGDILVGGEPIGFLHPLVRDAVYGEMTDTRRAQLHRRAAETLYAEGGAPERVSAHLLPAYRAGEPWAVKQLREAARSAIARGANGPVAAYLERALEEPPDPAERPQLLLELGRARARNSPVQAAADLEQALSFADEPLVRAEISRARSAALMNSARVVDAFECLELAIAQLPPDADPELRLRMEAEALAIGMLAPALAQQASRRIGVLPDLTGDTAGERLVLANVARHHWLDGAPAAEAADLAESALAGGALLHDQIPDSPTFGMTIPILLEAGRRKQAAAMVDLLHEDASRRGSVMGAAIATSLMASVEFRSGDVRALEALSRRALELSFESGWLPGIPLVVSFLITALTRRGELDEAHLALEHSGLAGEVSDIVSFFDWLLLARGALRIAQQRTREGLDDLLELGRRERVSGREDGLSWRTHAAPALASLGDRDRALALAEEELQIARRRATPWHLGAASSDAGHGTRRRCWHRTPARSQRASRTIDLAARARASPVRAGCGAAQAQPADRSSQAAARGARHRTPLRRDGAGEDRPHRAAGDGRTPAQAPVDRRRVSDGQRTARRGLGSSRPLQPRDRAGTVHHAQDRRAPPVQHLSQARHRIPTAIARSASLSLPYVYRWNSASSAWRRRKAPLRPLPHSERSLLKLLIPPVGRGQRRASGDLVMLIRDPKRQAAIADACG